MVRRRRRGSRRAREAGELHGARFAATALLLTVLLGAVAGARAAVSEWHDRPQVKRAVAAGHAVDAARRAMLAEESELHGFLLTGHTDALTRYYDASTRQLISNSTAVAAVAEDGSLPAALLATERSQATWTRWAGAQIATLSTRTPDVDPTTPKGAGAVTKDLPHRPAVSAAVVAKGHALFATYTKSADTLSAAVDGRLNDLLGAQQRTNEIFSAVQVGICLLLVGLLARMALLVTRQHRRRARATEALIPYLASGQLPPETLPLDDELRRVAAQSAAHAARARRSAEESAARVAELQREVGSYDRVLRLTREFAGSLDLHHLSGMIGRAFLDLGQADSVVLWTARGGEMQVRFSAGADVQSRAAQAVHGDEVAQAARFGQPQQLRDGDGGVALLLPLISAGRTVSVVELRWAGADDARTADRTGLDRLVVPAASALDVAAMHATVAHASESDELTGLYNRRRFNADAERDLRQAQRTGSPLSLIMLDLDLFKAYNDDFGHQAGDELLQTLSHTLTATLRDGDVAYRLGGEEFVVLLPGADALRAVAIAERLRVAVEGMPGRRTVTASFGVATAPDDATDVAGLLRCADLHLYSAKSLGRNQVSSPAPLPPQTVVRV